MASLRNLTRTIMRTTGKTDPEPGGNQAIRADKQTILIVEDNSDSREMLRTFLENAGYKVLEAEDGREAIEVARESLPDLLMIDLNLPVVDGISATREIRRLDGLRSIPVIANSASGSHGMGFFQDIDSLGEGYVEYLPKPFDFEYLIYLIRSLVPRKSDT
jgi:CheY-like chemotaxis protein